MARTFFYPEQLLTSRHLSHLHDDMYTAIRQLRRAIGTGIIHGFDVRVEGNQVVIAPGLAFDGDGQSLALDSALMVAPPVDDEPLVLCLRYHALIDEVDNDGRPLRERDSINISWLPAVPRDDTFVPLARIQRTAKGWVVDKGVARYVSRRTDDLHTEKRASPEEAGWQRAIQNLDNALSTQLTGLRQILNQWQEQLQLHALELEELRGEVAEVGEAQQRVKSIGAWQEAIANLREEFSLFTGDDLRDELEQLRADVATLSLRPNVPGSNAGAFTPITALHGVGSSYATTLESAGITTVSDLLNAVANPESRARLLATDISAARLRRWSREADLFRLHGCGTNEVLLLDSAGVTGTAALANEEARDLYERLRAVAAQRGDIAPPAYAWVRSWVAQAQHLPPVVEW